MLLIKCFNKKIPAPTWIQSYGPCYGKPSLPSPSKIWTFPSVKSYLSLLFKKTILNTYILI